MIDGTGTLTAIGGGDPYTPGTASAGGAGIGGGGHESGGVITIGNGTINAQGGGAWWSSLSNGGAGIGGGGSGTGGNSGTITINGGTVTAISDGNGYPGGAGIGGGPGATYGGALGGGGAGGTINITGGVVTAQGAQGGAGIGGGSGGNIIPTGTGGVGGAGGTILLSGGTIEATGGAGAAGIGGGAGGPGGTTGTVKITGGTIVVEGTQSVSDIGGGSGGAGGGSGTDGADGSGGSVTISGGSVNAVNKNISPAPSDDTNSVYLATLTVGSPAVAGGTSFTAGSIDGTACDTVQYDATSHNSLTGYGINDVKTDSTGKVYFWLPEAPIAESVSLTAGGVAYAKSFTRAADNNTAATLTDPTDARLFSVASQTITATGTGTISTSPKTASITVPYSKTSIVAATDIVAATFATMTLYSDNAFSVPVTSINLNVGSGNHLYIAVVAEDGTTKLYYDITVTRAADTNGGGSSITNASLSASKGDFDKNPESADHKDISITLYKGSYTLSKITCDGKTLTEGTDYTVSGAKYTFTADFLSTLDEGEQKITFDMNGGTDPVFTVTVTDTTPELWVNPFTDVPEGAWYYGDVKYAYENGLMNGTGESIFSPNAPLTRAMLVTILYRAEGSPEVEPIYAAHMMDVVQSAYYENAMGWAVKESIISGYGEGLYGPDDYVTREQFATFLYRYAQYKGGGFEDAWMLLLEYEDRETISEWAYEAACWCTMNGIITGKPGNLFDPQGQATRAEAAAMLHRFMENE